MKLEDIKVGMKVNVVSKSAGTVSYNTWRGQSDTPFYVVEDIDDDNLVWIDNHCFNHCDLEPYNKEIEKQIKAFSKPVVFSKSVVGITYKVETIDGLQFKAVLDYCKYGIGGMIFTNEKGMFVVRVEDIRLMYPIERK